MQVLSKINSSGLGMKRAKNHFFNLFTEGASVKLRKEVKTFIHSIII